MLTSRLFIFIIVIFVSSLLCAAPVFAGVKGREKVEQAILALDEIMAIPEKGMPPSLLANAKAIAILPNVIKAGVVIAGRFGRGIMLVRNENGQWGHPFFITIGGGSLGFQIGAQSTDVILVFKNTRGTEKIFRGKMTLGADAAVAAGPVGRRIEASTDETFRAGILSYSRSRGLFAGVSLEGSILSVDDEWNKDFYGRSVQAEKLIAGQGSVPGVAGKLKKRLIKYSGK